MGLVIQNAFMKNKPVDLVEMECESYSCLDAAEKVLDECANQSSMHYKDIARIAREKGWLVSNAKYPAHSLHSSIWKDTRKKAPSRFVMDDQTGMISLTKWGAAPFIIKVENHNKKQRKDLLALLRGMDPSKFESFVVAVVLPAMGFEECVATQRSHDKGIDAVGQLVIHDSVSVNVAVQIKRYGKTKVSSRTVRDLRGSLEPGQQGILITTSEYSSGARKEAEDSKKARISLLDGKAIVELLVNKDWEGDEKGIEVKHLTMIQVNKKFFTEFGITGSEE